MGGNIPIDTSDMIISGDVETMVRKMKRDADRGVDQRICYLQFGHLGNQAIERTIDGLGKEAIASSTRLDHATARCR